MVELSEEIKAFFEGQTAFTEVMKTAIFPIAVVENQPFPFTIYKILETQPATKDGVAATAQLLFYFGPNDYKKTAAFVDAMQLLIEKKDNYEWQSKTVDFLADAFSFVGIINIKIN